MLLAAADCLRRDDRPAPAARLLRGARDIADDAQHARIYTQLAGVLHQAGALAVARDLAQEAVSLAAETSSRVAARDTLLGTLVALGDLDAAASTLEAIRAEVGGAALSPVPFHEASALRRAGRFDEAAATYQAVIETFSAWPEASGAVAVARLSLAETRLFQQRPEQAQEEYARAEAQWADARRRSGVYRCEAGQLRAALRTGGHPLPRALSDRIAFAEQRQLPLLEAHLRIIRAGLRHHSGQPGADADLLRAVALAVPSEARFLEGRARLGLRALGRPTDAAHLRACLEGDAGWLAICDGSLPMIW